MKVSTQAITLQSAAPGGGREALSGAVQRWTQRPEHGPLITVIAAAVIIWSPPVQLRVSTIAARLYTLFILYTLPSAAADLMNGGIHNEYSAAK